MKFKFLLVKPLNFLRRLKWPCATASSDQCR